jgi:hypothetical protein
MSQPLVKSTMVVFFLLRDYWLTVSSQMFIAAPLYSPVGVSVRNTSSTSINVKWLGLEQNVIRGIFYGYEIWFTAHPEFPSAYVRYGMAIIFVFI